jgi:uncharacterized transporter YbjL
VKGRVLRTLGVAVVAGILLVAFLLPALDAMGRVLLMPPSYRPAARALLAALWLAGVGAAWAYRPPDDHGPRA